MHSFAVLKQLLLGIGFTLLGAAASRLCVLARDSKGVLLLETIIGTMVFSLVGVAVLASLSTAYNAGSKAEEQSVAENIARNQIEYSFSQTFQPPEQTPYITYTGVPADYAVTTAAEEVDPGSPDPDIERIIVTVTHHGKEIVKLKTLRFNQ